ncbi:MAG: Ig-like domain repeat protein [Phycisphaerales bacterium]|nr:MAG: Ig-like domain repeat protein [Phycisphaerales bacterium]
MFRWGVATGIAFALCTALPASAKDKGACCLPDGGCKDWSLKQCDKKEGVFNEGVACEAVECPQPGPCDLATLKTVCRRMREINKTVVVLKDGPAAEEVTFRFNGDPNTDIVKKTSSGGNAKVKIRGLPDGPNSVTVLFGGEECVSAEFECR